MDKQFCSFTAFKQVHKEQHQKILAKLQHLESEMAAGQEETTQLVARKFKKTPELQFKHKGNKKQFLFNDTVSDASIQCTGKDEERAPSRSQPPEDRKKNSFLKVPKL